VAPAAQSILAKLRQAGPQEITAEFALMLTAEAGAVIAKSTSGCHLTVTLHWERDNEPAGRIADPCAAGDRLAGRSGPSAGHYGYGVAGGSDHGCGWHPVVVADRAHGGD
jgi:Trypsin-co-occurring domain 1